MDQNATTINAQAQRNLLLILFSGVFMAALDVAIVAPALPLLRGAFEIDNRQVSLFIVLYSLCSLASTAPLASMSDRFGRRPVYLGSIGAFAAGSLLVAVAPSFPLALLGRAIQGLSAGGITPAASAVIGDVFPPEQRGRALGLIGATFGMAFLAGPLLASLILLTLSWQWLFLLNLPVALAIITAGLRTLPKARRSATGAPFDLLGTLVGVVLLTAVVFGINRVADQVLGRVLWPWLLLVAAACLPPLIAIERRAARPLVPLGLFGLRQLNLAYALTVGAGFGMGSVVYIASLAVAAFGVAEQQAGLLLLPLVLASTAGSVLFGRLLNQLGSRLVLLAGFALLAVGSTLLGLFPESMPNFFVASIVLGLGVGNVVGGALRFIVLNEVTQKDRAAAQGLVNIGTSIGNLLAVATLGAIADSQGGGAPGYAAAYLVAAAVAGAMLGLTVGLKGRAAEQQTMIEQAQETSPASASG